MNTQRAIREYQDNSPSWDEYYAEQLHRAERHALRVDPATFVQRTVWQAVKDELKAWRRLLAQEYREHPAAFLAVGLVWLAVLGIGLVMLAVRNGWIQ